MDLDCVTSVHVRRVTEGDLESLAWLVARYTPLLLAQAETRLTPALRRAYDSTDLVNDVWCRSLGSLKNLEPYQGSYSLAVLKYLSTVLVRRVIRLVERHISHLPPEDLAPLRAPETDSGLPISIIDATSGVVTSLIRSESVELVRTAIDELEPGDRKIVVLCGIEQRPHQDVALTLGISRNLVAQRYRRAILRLRRRVPSSVFEDLALEPI